MSEELETAQRYRLHAEELRGISNDAVSPEISEKLTRIADDYERMARTLEAIDATNKASKKPQTRA